MAALRTWKSLQTKCSLISSLRGSHSLRCDQLTPMLSFRGLQAAQRTYSSSAKESSESDEDLRNKPSESDEDLRNKPIRFSTSRARHMSISQTLGVGAEIQENPSKTSIYVGMFLMAIMTYIIFFLPAEKDELDVLELEIEKYEKEKAERQ